MQHGESRWRAILGAAKLRCTLVGNTEESAMRGKMALIVLVAITVTLSVVPASAGGDMGGGGDRSEGGGIVRCSLDGINPAHHPEIFGNPAVAASYGFVRSPDGTWHVQPNCRR
jgi:hypothetical protein